MAHAEASARTVDAAVAAAAAKLGLRPDRVDVEVLEDPVPSTFGYIGSPARVRVTPRPEASSGAASGTSAYAAGGEARGASAAQADTTRVVAAPPYAAGGLSSAAPGRDAPASSAPAESFDVAQATASTQVGVPGPHSDPAQPASPTSADPTRTSDPTPAADAAPAADQRTSDLGRVNDSAATTDQSPPAGGSFAEPFAVHDIIGDNRTTQSYGSAVSEATTTTGSRPGEPGQPATDATAGSHPTGSPPAEALNLSGPPGVATSPTTAPSAGSGTSGAPDQSPAVPTSMPRSSSSAGAPEAPPGSVLADTAVGRRPLALSGSDRSVRREPRRTDRDEPIEPEMVEADTERAGDFLEGLLDALDVDGDITTWVDEAGGHVDLEGSDLDMLVGSNGETLNALQELTRIAVLRQSKRRVRLLLDINGYRARQRDQLISATNAAVERVITTRQDHEFEPMTPAERKVVHDVVAVIDGVRTESLGEEPYRRVVIRPA